jgi:hypothetical protein
LDEQFAEPTPAFFSNPEVIEAVAAEPLPPKLNVWYLLARLEYKLNTGDEVFRHLEDVVGGEEEGPPYFGYRALRLLHLLRNMRLEDLVPEFAEYASVLRKTAARAPELNTDFSDSYELKRLLFAALIHLVANNRYASVPLSKWREAAAKYPAFDDSLDLWFNFVEKSISASAYDLTATLVDNTAQGEERLIAALLLSAEVETNVEVRYRADLTLTITDMHVLPWVEATGEIICSIVSRQWARVAEEERFALRFPTVNSITIKAACDDSSCGGLRKVARIMLAAKAAVQTSLSPDALAKLEERAR